MAFRMLLAGGRHFADYPLLRATLDALLANRLPDVDLLTAGGPGVPMLAASYPTRRGLALTARVSDFRRSPGDAVERRGAFLVGEADAALVVWDGRNPHVRRVLELVERKGMSVHVLGALSRRTRRSATPRAKCSPQTFHRHCGTAVATTFAAGHARNAARESPTLRGPTMRSDILDRSDLYRLADDGCQNVPDRDTGSQDLSELWADPGKDDQVRV